MDVLTWKEVITTFLFPLILGSYVYAWYGASKLWGALEKHGDKMEKLRLEIKDEMRLMRENDIRHLEERVERLEHR